MAICGFCGIEMTTGKSCAVEALHVDGHRVELARYGSESGVPRSSRRCGDCGVGRGGLHHPGCDLQRCPLCTRQLLTCPCRFDEDGSSFDDALDAPAVPLGVDPNGYLLERGSIGGIELIIRRDDIPSSDITTVYGIRVTTALRTVIDLAATVEWDHFEEMVDDALDRGLFTEAEAWERLSRPDMADHVGAALLRRLLSDERWMRSPGVRPWPFSE
jgi:hypothetical protein